ncbi:hypothetical protein ABMA28_009718 [Loxostege sticticalis]|uniref:Osiris 7 n=1 Tax=Loxostege sticticalis TaxID=481309 RepID=A0ABD0SDF7_LOXSC
MWRTVAFAALAAACVALPAQETGHSDNDLEGIGDCLRKDSTTCLKYKFFSFVDKMIGQKESFALTDGVTVVKASDVPAETGAPRSLDPVARLKNYFETHSLRVEVKGADVIDAVSSAGRALEDTVSNLVEDESEEGRGKKKKAAKLLGPLMAALALKLMALTPIAIGAIALIAGKALLIGKLALVLSAIIGLKKLLSQQKHVTYEVVAHPHHTSSHTSSHDYGGTSGYGGDSGGYSSGGGGGGGHGGGWGRSLEAQSLAYSAQKPQ